MLMVQYMVKGIVGIQGPIYEGTGCFHRRKVIYGLQPDDFENEGKDLTSVQTGTHIDSQDHDSSYSYSISN